MEFLYILAIIGVIAILVVISKKLSARQVEKNGKQLLEDRKVDININVDEEINKLSKLDKSQQDERKLSLLYHNASTLCCHYALIKYRKNFSSSDTYLTHEIYGEEIIMCDFSLLPLLPSTAQLDASISGSEIYTELRRDDTEVTDLKHLQTTTKTTFYKVPLGDEIKVYSLYDRGRVAFIFMNFRKTKR